MKRFITLSTLFLICMAINAQVQLNIETTAGGLKDAMTEEQRQTVTNLTLTGSMNDADFYLIRDEMLMLDTLNIKEVNADTIPARAFYEREIKKIYLPQNVKYLADSSFQWCYGTIIISGQFPGLGENVFTNNSYQIDLSEDNEYCRKIGENIYSMDGKTLFLFLAFEPFLTAIPDGTETIASRAFDSAYIRELKFPASLKKIEEHAFTNTKLIVPTGTSIEDEPSLCLYFKSSVPPVLEGDVFNDNYGTGHFSFFSFYFIRVPIGSGLAYKNADEQWSIFEKIQEYDFNPQSIFTSSNSQLKTIKQESNLYLSCEYPMIRIDVVSPQGKLFYSTNSNQMVENVPLQPGINIVKVTFGNKSTEVIKILN